MVHGEIAQGVLTLLCNTYACTCAGYNNLVTSIEYVVDLHYPGATIGRGKRNVDIVGVPF